MLRICQILNMEKALHFCHTLGGEVHRLFLFIHNKITGLIVIFFHDDVHFRQFFCRSPLKLLCQVVTCFIDLGRFSTAAGNDQRCPRLVDKYRVHLVHNGIVKLSLYQLLFINNHVITEIIKSKLIIRSIGNITVIGFSSLIIVHAVQDTTHCQPKKLMDLSHPLRITLRQIVIDRNDMDTLAL